VTARTIDGAAIARSTRASVTERVTRFHAAVGRAPGLATVLVGEDPASQVYVASKRRLATACGFADHHRLLPSDVSQAEVARVIEDLVADDRVDGILLQLPLPVGLEAAPLLDLIPASKDVDGLTTVSAGLLARRLPGLRPCTPAGIMRLLDETGVPLVGVRAVVVGASELVGRPMAQLLLERGATVTIAHALTRDLPAVTREADVLVVATGVPGLITPGHVRPGAVVMDVGITRTDDGLRGDVAFDAVSKTAGAITPVPGGVGPMTIAMLLENTITAAEMVMAGSMGDLTPGRA